MQNIFIELTRIVAKLQYMEECIRNARDMDSLFIYVIEELVFQDEIVQLHNLIGLLKSDILGDDGSDNFHDEIRDMITTLYKKINSGYSNNIHVEPIPVSENNTTGNVPLFEPSYPDEHEEPVYPSFYSHYGELQ